MSVLIKGMRFPQNCVHCELCHDEGFCIVTGTTINMWGQKRNADCPLIELPDHGRLIDADALKMKMQIGDCTKEGCGESKHRYGSYCWLDDKGAMMCDAINEAPTVIPAERSEDE